MIDQEIESIQSILNEQELVVYDINATGDSTSLIQGEEAELACLRKLVKFSLIPQCNEARICMVDQTKGINLELRSLPPIEVFVLLPESYPSAGCPLFMMASSIASNSLFYDSMRTFLYERLGEKWTADMLVLYECCIYIKDEFLD
jgi:hypothetical protein